MKNKRNSLKITFEILNEIILSNVPWKHIINFSTTIGNGFLITLYHNR